MNAKAESGHRWYLPAGWAVLSLGIALLAAVAAAALTGGRAGCYDVTVSFAPLLAWCVAPPDSALLVGWAGTVFVIAAPFAAAACGVALIARSRSQTGVTLIVTALLAIGVGAHSFIGPGWPGVWALIGVPGAVVVTIIGAVVGIFVHGR